MKSFYPASVELQMQTHYGHLSEKDRRHYGAIEALKLGHGGKTYIASLFGMSKKTLYKGLSELTNEALYGEIPIGKQRRLGGGRKKILPIS
jgi:DNA invertase Pin-like site-specific DNA recombinase